MRGTRPIQITLVFKAENSAITGRKFEATISKWSPKMTRRKPNWERLKVKKLGYIFKAEFGRFC